VRDAAVLLVTVPWSLPALGWGVAWGGRPRPAPGCPGLIACGGMRGGYPRGGTTVGAVFLHGAGQAGPALLRHERVHVTQWALLGPVFPLAYAVAELVGSRERNVFERWAGLAAGGYAAATPYRRPMDLTLPRVPSSALAAAGLLGGYGVAVAATRPVGGLVLAAVGAACGVRWRRSAGAAVAAGLLAVYVSALVGAHILAGPVGLGAWTSVLLAAAACAAIVQGVTHAAGARPRRRLTEASA